LEACNCTEAWLRHYSNRFFIRCCGQCGKNRRPNQFAEQLYLAIERVAAQ
jgi:hypothetical protein